MKSFYKLCLVLIMHNGIHFSRWYIKKYDVRGVVVITTSQLGSTGSAGSAQVKILLVACCRFVMGRISDNDPDWKYGLSFINHTTKTNYHPTMGFVFPWFSKCLSYHYQKQCSRNKKYLDFTKGISQIFISEDNSHKWTQYNMCFTFLAQQSIALH